MAVRVIADPEYQEYFQAAFRPAEAWDGLESVLIDARFLDPKDKLRSLNDEPSALVITNTLTHSATAYAAAYDTGWQQQSVVYGIPMVPGVFGDQKRVECVRALGSDEADVTALFDLLGKQIEQTNDSIAGVFPRTLSMIINEAAFALQESVASAEDIDNAMKLGTNYPKGPLAWCDEIGARTIVAILDALAAEYGSDRYRVSSRLRRHAEAGLPFYSKS